MICSTRCDLLFLFSHQPIDSSHEIRPEKKIPRAQNRFLCLTNELKPRAFLYKRLAVKHMHDKYLFQPIRSLEIFIRFGCNVVQFQCGNSFSRWLSGRLMRRFVRMLGMLWEAAFLHQPPPNEGNIRSALSL